MLLRLKIVGIKSYFHHYDNSIKFLCTIWYLPLHRNFSTRLHILMQPNVSLKTWLYEIMSITISKYTIPSTIFDKSFKIKATFSWTFLLILLTSGAITKQSYYQTKQYCAIFSKSEMLRHWTTLFFKSPYRVLQGIWKLKTLKCRVYFTGSYILKYF